MGTEGVATVSTGTAVLGYDEPKATAFYDQALMRIRAIPGVQAALVGRSPLDPSYSNETIFLSDRVVMMTSGPYAHVGEILEVPFERPRDRHQLMDSPEFYELRERLVTFLENQGHNSPPPRVSVPKPRRSSLWDLLISRSPG